MKLSLKWLQSYFETTPDWELVWERLTQAGIEIEEIKPVGAQLSNVVVAKVIECVMHPDADKLKVCTVDAGDKEHYTIVCGASNVTTGVIVPCAKIGAVLPNGIAILERKMRGITSCGMLCAGEEIGIASHEDGLLLLPPDAPIGMDIAEYLELDDKIVEFKITPNRGDCLSVKGILREIEVLTGYKTKPIGQITEFKANTSTQINIFNQEKDICPNYIALTINQVNNKAKLPPHITRILERSGMRSISPLVDIANFVMLETGQPLHIFDLDKVGNQLGVRFAANLEELKILTEDTVKLNPSTLVITDSKNQPQAIAGVMGGSESSVTLNTTNIVIECAFFTPETITGIAKHYKVASESAMRFERGVDYMLPHQVIKYVASLIKKYCGGEIGQINIDTNNEALSSKEEIELTFSRINQVIGVNIPRVQILDILNSLSFNVRESNETLKVIAPSHRFDINISADVIEEIARIFGYDNIKASMPVTKLQFRPENSLHNFTLNTKKLLVNMGFVETICYSFLEEKYEDLMGIPDTNAIKLQNPIANWGVMRTSLIADLVKTLKNNLSYGHEDIKLFELGRVFSGEDDSSQILKLAGLIYGNKNSLNGLNKAQAVDFYTLKSVTENILAKFPDIYYETCLDYSTFHNGRCAKIYSGSQYIGVMGQLHPKICQEMSLSVGPYLFELDIEALSKLKAQVDLKEIKRFPKVKRDLAFIMDKNVEIDKVLDSALNAEAGTLIAAQVFDVYSKDMDTTKSVAVNFTFQADKTLTDEEIKGDLERIKNNVCNQCNAHIRE